VLQEKTYELNLKQSGKRNEVGRARVKQDSITAVDGKEFACNCADSTMSKVEEKEIKLEIGLPEAGYPRSMYFNRVRIEREDGLSIVQFGFVTNSGILDSYSCILTKETLKQNQNNLLEYLGRIGRPAEKPAMWKGTVEKHTEVADIIAMSFQGTMAETCLFAFSMTAATRLRRANVEQRSITAQPLILLRSTAETQKELIVSLYEE
jgi:hypothetical protein